MIAKPNLPHKLNGLHLKGEEDGVKEKTGERATEGEGHVQNKEGLWTHQQTKKKNTATRSLTKIFESIMLLPATYRSHLLAIQLTHQKQYVY